MSKDTNRNTVKAYSQYRGDSATAGLLNKMDAYAVVLFCILTVVLVLLEWGGWFLDYARQPLVWTVYAALVIPYPAFRLATVRRKLYGIRYVTQAHKTVAHYLEELQKEGYSVFPHVKANGFELEHVVAGKNGIFIVESAIYRRLDTAKARLRFDGTSITMDEDVNANHLIEQIRRKQSWLEESLRQSLGKHLPVLPVLVFPGWTIDATKSAYGNKLWVLSPKSLSIYIQHTSEKLKEEDCQLVAYQLSRLQYVG